MPYADPDRQRQAARESARRRTRAKAGPIEPLNRETPAGDLYAVVLGELARVRKVTSEDKVFERARVVALLVTTALRCVEQADIAARLEQIEALIEQQRAGNGRGVH